MADVLNAQYENVKNARGALFSYCESIQMAHLLQPVGVFNNTSMSNLLVHIANTYLHWLVFFETQAPVTYFDDKDIRNMGDIRAIYQKVDDEVEKFLARHNDNLQQVISQYPLSRRSLVATTPLQLFTHAITHEFHHKGQILSMSRQLGYIPVDTDVIRS